MIAHLTDQNAIMVRWSDDVCPNEAKTMIREHSLRRYDDDQRTWLDLASLPPVHPHSKHPRSPKEALAKTTPAMIEMMINMKMMMIWQNQPYDDHDVCALEVFPSLGPDFQPWGRKYLQTTLKVSLPSICKSRNTAVRRHCTDWYEIWALNVWKTFKSCLWSWYPTGKKQIYMNRRRSYMNRHICKLFHFALSLLNSEIAITPERVARLTWFFGSMPKIEIYDHLIF